MASTAEINKASKRSSAWIKKRQKSHTAMMNSSIKELQDRILILSNQLSIDSAGKVLGPVQNWSKAQTIHSGIERVFSTEYNSTARSITREFSAAQADVVANFGIMGSVASFNDVDRAMFSALRDGYYQDYLAVGNAAKSKIVKGMYQHVIGGSSFGSLETTIRSALLGSKAKSAIGRPLANYARLYARDMIANYHNDVMMVEAEKQDMSHFKYIGTIMAGSRKFCIRRVGRTFKRETIQSWNYKWKGKSGPALTHRGGYNCRHHWQPVRPEWLSEQAQNKIDVLKKYKKPKIN